MAPTERIPAQARALEVSLTETRMFPLTWAAVVVMVNTEASFTAQEEADASAWT